MSNSSSSASKSSRSRAATTASADKPVVQQSAVAPTGGPYQAQEKLRCSVGVTAYNEETNIGPLLAALIDQHLHQVEIAEIIVVASACTDQTVPIVRTYMDLDARLKLIEQERREG